MVKCCVPNCTATSSVVNKLVSGTGFHRFPKDTDRINAWSDRIKRKNWEANVYSRICSAHFSEDSFYFTKNGARKLRKSAIPTEHLPTDIVETSTEQEKQPATPIDPELQFHPDDTAIHKKLKCRILRLEEIKKQNKRTIKTLYQRMIRLKKRLGYVKKTNSKVKKQ